MTSEDNNHRLADAEPSDQPADAGPIEETLPRGTPIKKRTISESADKIVVTTNVKRGTETRDEDKIRVKIKGDSPKGVVDKLNVTLARLDATANTMRNLQPEVVEE